VRILREIGRGKVKFYKTYNLLKILIDNSQ